MADTRLTILITAQDKATSEIKKLSSQVKKLSSELTKIKSASTNIKKVGDASKKAAVDAKKLNDAAAKLVGTFRGLGALRLVKAIGALFIIRKVGQFVVDATRAFAAQEKAMARLTTVMTNVSNASKEQIEDLAKQARALQKTTLFGDELIISAQAMLGTFQLTASEIKQITPRILDMGAAMEKAGGSGVDLESITIAVGKAMTLGVGSLTRYGVVITDVQKKAFELADRQEKVDILTKALDANFKGIAEGSAKTLAGGVEQLKNTFGDFSENVGRAALVLSSDLVQAIGINISAMNEQEAQTNGMIIVVNRLKLGYLGLGLAILEISSFFKKGSAIVGKAIGTFVDKITGMSGSAEFFQNQIDDVDQKMNALRLTIGDTANDIDKMSSELKEGTFDWNTYLGRVSGGSGIMNQMAAETEGLTKEQQNLIKSVSTLTKEFNDLDKEGTKAILKLNESHKKFTTETNQGFDDLNDKLSEVTQDGADDMRKLSQSFFDTSTSINKSIRGIRLRMAELSKSFEQAKNTDVKSLAQAFIDAEAKIAGLREQIRQSTDSQEIVDLKNKLKAEENALASTAETQEQFAEQIKEARRRAGLTDLQRAIEDFKIKRSLAQEEFNARNAELQREKGELLRKRDLENRLFLQRAIELKQETEQKVMAVKMEILELQKKSQEERKLLREKRSFIADAEQFLRDEIEKTKDVTIKNVDTMINRFKALSSAIKEAAGASSSAFVPGLGGVSAVSGGAGGGNIVNISGTFLSENAAEQIVDLVLSKLKQQVRI